MSWLVAGALSIVVVTYNNLINRWGPFQGSAYVPINLLLAGALTALTAIGLDLSAAASCWIDQTRSRTRVSARRHALVGAIGLRVILQNRSTLIRTLIIEFGHLRRLS